jgi:phosphoglucosamine mutase
LYGGGIMRKFFGTDGVRGLANRVLTPELAFNLGLAAAIVLTEKNGADTILIGKDTRVSGDMLEAALAAGICSAGLKVISLGVLPTPGVSLIGRQMNLPGAMVSASHNNFADNGIKFFNNEGFKISVEDEYKIEALLNEGEKIPRPDGGGIGYIRRLKKPARIYAETLKKRAQMDLSGFKIVLDCANGAGSVVGGDLFRHFGAEVVEIFHKPDGCNINANCGSTSPAALIAAVAEHKAHIGLALDGDADRILAVDEKGAVLPGDCFLGICAAALKEDGLLNNSSMVLTVMSNLGLVLHMRSLGIKVWETPVGDRFVAEKMAATGSSFGGEQSGHIIIRDFGNTGDGLASALYLLKVMSGKRKPLSELGASIKLLPQAQINVPVSDKNDWERDEDIMAAYREAEKALNGRGRVVLRASGTERLIRVMTEGEDSGEINALAEHIAAVIKKKRG